MSGLTSIATLMAVQSLPPRTPSLLFAGLPWHPLQYVL
jgi:hypothetical protein